MSDDQAQLLECRAHPPEVLDGGDGAPSLDLRTNAEGLWEQRR